MTTLSSGSSPAIPLYPPVSTGSGTLKLRLVAGGAALAASMLLALAAWLTPAEAGIGTHEQMNLPPCSWPTLMGIPCITCGMTTSFSHAAEGSFLKSFTTQPMGFLLALATAMTALLGFYIALTGSPIASYLFQGWSMNTTWVIIALFLAAWGYKVAQFRGWIL